MSDHDPPAGTLDVGAYCREVESFLCRRNGGHLIRLVGPAFSLVRGWAEAGVPLRIVLHGIDRTVSRLEARGPRRRPVRLEFCEADVRDAYDQWRRAVGAHGAPGPATPDVDGASDDDGRSVKRQPSLTRHVERVIERLSSVRASTPLAPAAGQAVDAALAALDAALAEARGARGAARLAIHQRLQEIDDALLEGLVEGTPDAHRASLVARATAELRPLRARLSDLAYRDAETRVVRHLVRAELQVPEIVLA